MNVYLKESLIQSKIFYYLATGSDDLKYLRESTELLHNSLKGLESKNFEYNFDNFDGATHYSLEGRGIPTALEKIFRVYRPISKEEFSEVIMKLDTPVHLYLLEKYKTIETLFGITNPIRENDFIAAGVAADKKKQWESLREIGSLSKRQYPNKIMGDYFTGRYYEETGNPKKAMRTFQGAYDKEEVDFITIDLLLDRATKIKDDFGY